MSRLDVQKGAGGGGGRRGDWTDGRTDGRTGEWAAQKARDPSFPLFLLPSLLPFAAHPKYPRDPITSLFSANPQTRYPSVGEGKEDGLVDIVQICNGMHE